MVSKEPKQLCLFAPTEGLCEDGNHNFLTLPDDDHSAGWLGLICQKCGYKPSLDR